MEIRNLLDIKTRDELRAWLTLNSAIESEAWIPFSHKPIEGKLVYLDVVEEALCFGWIDSTNKPVEGGRAQRISPRKKRGNWSELNKERVRRLEKLGLMTDAGMKCLPDMGEDSFTVLPQVLAAIQSDSEVYKKYLELPELYKRVRIDTIQWCLKAKQPDLYEKRLQRFIENTRAGKLYGNWNDDGLL